MLRTNQEADACSPQVLQRVRGGAAVALVSDAGVPAVSDPGALLVASAAAQGLPVIPVPGRQALTAQRSPHKNSYQNQNRTRCLQSFQSWRRPCSQVVFLTENTLWVFLYPPLT